MKQSLAAAAAMLVLAAMSVTTGSFAKAPSMTM